MTRSLENIGIWETQELKKTIRYILANSRGGKWNHLVDVSWVKCMNFGGVFLKCSHLVWVKRWRFVSRCFAGSNPSDGMKQLRPWSWLWACGLGTCWPHPNLVIFQQKIHDLHLNLGKIYEKKETPRNTFFFVAFLVVKNPVNWWFLGPWWFGFRDCYVEGYP